MPSLGDRFDLAFGLGSAVAYIVAINWIHRVLRSSNTLLFGEWIIRKVYLVGFTYARKDKDPGQLSNLPVEERWALYRPPPVDEVTAGDVASSDEDAGLGEDEYSVQGKEVQRLDGETNAIIQGEQGKRLTESACCKDIGDCQSGNIFSDVRVDHLYTQPSL